MDRYKGLTLAGDDNTRDTFIAAAVAQIWADIASGAAESQPALLWRFVTVTFAELKKYHFYYWCVTCLSPAVGSCDQGWCYHQRSAGHE